MPEDYCTLAEVKAEGGYFTSSDDLTLEAIITATSRQIENHCGRRFWQDDTVVVREFFADPDDRSIVDLLDQPGTDPKVEISTTSGLIVKTDSAGDGTFATTLTIGTHFILEPRNAEDDARPYSVIRILDDRFPVFRSGRAGVQVTAQFGWPSNPDPVKRAAIIQTLANKKAAEAPLGAMQLGDTATVFQRSVMHPTAKLLLAPYQRVPVG